MAKPAVRQAPVGVAGGALGYLLYHHVLRNPAVDTPAGRPGARYAISAGGFARELNWLAGHAHVVPHGQVPTWQDGTRQLPPRSVLISFDGANAEWSEDVALLLQQQDLPATFYVVSGWLGQVLPNGLRAIDAASLRRLAAVRGRNGDALFTIASHSVSHSLGDLSDKRLRAELADSRACLQDITGQEVAFFALPDGQGAHGESARRVAEVAAGCGYLGIRASDLGTWNTAATSRWLQSCRYVAMRRGERHGLAYVVGEPTRARIANRAWNLAEGLRWRAWRKCANARLAGGDT